MNQNTRLEIIPFNGNKIYCPVINGEPYVLINSIIDSIGLNYKSAIRNITSDRFKKYTGNLSIGKVEKQQNQSTDRWTSFEKNGEKTEFLTHFGTEWVPLLSEIKGYEYVVLPVRKLPAWLYSLDISKVKEDVRPILMKYQDECDDILFNHFFGPMAQRKTALLDSFAAKQRILELKELLSEDERYAELVELSQQVKSLGNEMTRIDRDIVNQQKTLFDVNEE